MRVLGVDPGLAETGYAVVEVSDGKGIPLDWNTVRTDPGDAMPKRLQKIFTDFEKIIKKWNVHFVVLEDVYVLPRYPNAALQLGAVQGVVKLAAARENVEVKELKPTELKMALTGNGRAGKDQVERVVRKILRFEEKIKPDHVSDALALAVVGLSRFGKIRW
ncbi:MAG: crossover junction endodeoxyribonuclease RuvC [Deltaproteobacteria bacterium]|nr:crossover junction endodeoxyribonuclease RuvC [Deltaproteobacteria bacterium]